MKATILLTAGLIALGASAQDEPKASTGGSEASPLTSAPTPQSGYVYKPESSKDKGPGRMHTTYVLRSVDGNKPKGVQSFEDEFVINPDSVELAETPCSLGNLYVDSPSTACIPSFTATGGPSAAGHGAIALVDAYDNPHAASDLAGFDTHFGLPAATFTKIWANGNGSCKTVPVNDSWALEESLDIEWAHVFAPNAAIVLVEACSDSTGDLLYAEQTAFKYIVANHPSGGQVSNSWGGAETAGQIADDEYFTDFIYNGSKNFTPPILAFASAGDDGAGVSWPSSSPWVIAAGGTSILRHSSGNAFSSEACWSGSGGGTSTVETYATTFTGGNVGPWADFQYPIYGQNARSTPDMSFDADPASGVYVLSQVNGGWFVVGGTSLSSASLAGIVNRAGNKLGSVHVDAVNNNAFFASWENNLLYSQLPTKEMYAANFYDVTTGSNGFSAVAGYDQCTGLGSPRGLNGK